MKQIYERALEDFRIMVGALKEAKEKIKELEGKNIILYRENDHFKKSESTFANLELNVKVFIEFT